MNAKKSKRQVRAENNEAVRAYWSGHTAVAVSKPMVGILDKIGAAKAAAAGTKPMKRPEIVKQLIRNEAKRLGLDLPEEITGNDSTSDAGISQISSAVSPTVEEPVTSNEISTPAELPKILGEDWELWQADGTLWVKFMGPDPRRFFLKNTLGFRYQDDATSWKLVEQFRPVTAPGLPVSNDEVFEFAKQHLEAKDDTSRSEIHRAIVALFSKPAHVAGGT